MCDCFNLGFPNWHGSLGTGSGRRLKGPEPDTVDDSICEEPSEFIEGDRPRPQGSSPVDEYPETDKYKNIDKQGGGGKKGKRGFGSLFEKRSPAKMSQLESPESGVIVKMAKETCSEGLVVSGGKEGIFIKEVRPESPASKLLSVHEGDQILSATVYFDDVTYEDALQILEHAQPYKMELLLKRKPIKTSTLESEPALEIIQVEEGSSPEMRGHSKTKRHGDRISWPKFPSFSKSQKSHFKRSHSTSEADDKRKLELSPTTSDTESPIKSQEAVKGKTKKHKIKLSSMKMKGRKSMSVEQPDQDTDILTVERVEGMENQLSQDDIHSPEGLESASVETSQVYVLESESEKNESTKIRNKCILPELAGSETKQHKVELISLDKTLKTTDITVALADQESPSTKKSPEGKKNNKENKERSELKFTFKGNEKKDKHKQNIPVKSSLKSLKTPRADMMTSDLSAHANTLLSPTVVSHTELEECQLPIDINTQVIINESSGKTLPSTDMEISMPKVDISLDMPDIGLIRKSPQIGQEQHLKETYVKTDVNAQDISIHAKVISITMEPDSQMEIQASKLPTERSIVLAQIGARSAPKCKLPRVDRADFVTDKPIKMTDVKIVEMDVKGLTVEDKGLKILPSREDIEIPGMEDASLTSTKAPVIKQPKTAFTLPVEEIQAQTVQMVIDVDRVKKAVSKLPGFKLPKGDIAGLPAHQQITMTDVNAERVTVTVDATLSNITDIKAQLDTYVKKTDINALPEKLSRSSVTTFKLPKTQLSDLGAHEPITMTEIDHTKIKQEAGKTKEDEIQIELYKPENLEKAGIETIQQKGTPNKVEKEKETGEILEPKLAVPVPDGPTITSEERNRIPATYTKGLDKKSKKANMSMPGFGITQTDTRFPDIGIGLPKRDTSVEKKDEVKDESKALYLEMKMSEAEIKLSKVPDSEYSIIKTDHQTPTIGTLSSETMPEVPSSDIKGAVMDIDVQSVDVGRADVQLSDVEVKVPSGEVEIPETVYKYIDVKMKKQQMSFTKFGVKEPEIDVSVPKPDISLPKGNMEVKLPEVEIEAPEIQVEVKDTVGSPSRFKMPTLKFPQFGAAAPNITVEVLDGDKDIKVHGSEIPELRQTMSAINIEKPSVDFKGPSIDVDVKGKRLDIVTLPEASVEVQPPSTELKVPSGKDEIPEGAAKEIDVKMKKTRMSFGWFSKSEVKAPEVDVSLPKGDISLPEGKVEVKQSEVEIKAPEIQVEMKHVIEFQGQGSKFKLPKFGISLPKVKGPEFDLSVSKTDVDVDLPERRADLQLPDVEVGVPSVEVEIPEAVSKDIDVKMKKPRMSFPKFGFSKSEVKAPEVDVSLPEVDISLAEEKVEVKEPEVEIEAPKYQVEVKDTVGSPSRFKMPTLKFPQFGAAAPNITVEVLDVNKDIKVHESEIPETKLTMSAINIEKPSVDLKGPSIDVDVKSERLEIVTLPEASVEVKPPDVEIKVPSGKDEIPEGVATEIDVKMRKPRMSFGWFSKPEVKAPEVDVSLPKGDISLPEGKVEVKQSEVEIKAPEIQVEMKHGTEFQGQGSKFKLPKFGISLPKVKGPEFDLSVSKTDVDVDLPERRADLQLPDVEVGVPSVEVEIPEAVSKDIDVKMKKPRMSFPKFGFSKPEVKAPEVDVSFPEVDISLAEEKVEVKELEVEIEAPEIQVEVKDTVGSPSRFKMPTLKFPQFGAAAPNITVEVLDVDKDIKVHESEIPETKLTMSAINIEKPSVDLKGPSIDVDVKSERLEIVTLPEASVEVKPLDVEIEVPSGKDEIPEGVATEIDVKMRKPRMSFGWFSKPEVKAPEVDVSLPKGDISLPEGKVEVRQSEVEIKAPEIQVEMKHGIEFQGQVSKFKLPTFGISLPKVKGPEFDLSVSKTDVDVDLPERRADLQLPDVEVGVPSVEVEIPEAVSKDIDVKMKKPRMSFPKFGFSKPEVKAPEVDVSLPEVDISLPEEKVEVKEPEMEIEAPEIQVEVKDTVDTTSRFKMPTLKFPKFGAAAPNITVEVPDVDKDIKVHESEIPETKLTMSAINIEKPSVDLKGPSIDVDVKSERLEIVTLPEASVEVKPPDVEIKVPSGKDEIPEGVATEIDVKMRKPRMSFGWFSKPEVKAPEVDVSLPKGDISLPEGKVEVKQSEVEIKAPEIQVEMKHGTEFQGQGSKFKLPKFGISLPKVKGPEFDLSVSKTDVDVDLPERRADLQLPDVEVGVPSVEVEIPEAVSKDIDVKMKKPRMSFPKFGFSKPEVKAPEVDVSLPEVDISLPEEKVEVKEPEMEIEAPEIQVEVKDTVGSPSRFKMPTLKFPQFGAAAPNITVEVLDVNKDIKVHESEIPETKLTMSAINIEKPSVDLKGPSIDVDVKSERLEIVTLPEASVEVKPPDVEIKVPSGKDEIPEGVATEIDVKMRKPRMSFGWFSKPEVKAPEVDVSLPKGDISLPEGKVEVKQSEVEIKAPEIQVEMKHGIEFQGQVSKFKLPKFGISLPKVKGPEFDLSVSKTDVDVDLPERRADLQLPDVEVGVPSVEVELPEAVSKDIDVKMKKPRMSFPKFGFSKLEVKAPEVDVSLPEVDISLPEEKVEVKEPEMEIEAPEIQVEIKYDVEHEGQGSIFKPPTFGMTLPKVKGPEMDLSVSKKVIEVTLPEASVEFQPPSVELKVPSGEIEMPEGADTGIDVKMKTPRTSFGWFSKPEVKPPEVDVSLPKVDISLPEGNVEVKEPEVEMKAPESQVEMKHEGLSVDRKLETSEMGFKMATFKFPKFGANSKVVVDVSDKEKDIKVPGVEIIDQLLGASLQIDLPEPKDTVDIKGSREVQLHDAGSERPSVEGGMAIAEVDVHEVEVSKLTFDDKGHGSPSKGQGSPSKFKLPTFKMPKWSISKSKPDNEHDDINPNVILENNEIQVKPQTPEKSPKLTLTTFGEVLRSIDVEFDVLKLEEVEEKLTGSREDITASGKTDLNAQTSVETQSVHKEEEAKEKSKFGSFNFPTSPSESAKILEKYTSEKERSEKSPDSVEQDVSLTFSVHSSDAFADISSTVTSEQFGPSLASPTKVTVKYSDPTATEVQGDVITSTARTKMISFEPYLAEKVTIPMSSGVSSSSVDTLKLESGTHVSTSNIQVIPDTRKATLLTDFGLQTGTAGVSSASWSVDDTNKTQSDGQTVIEKHVVREMSGTDKETVFITKKVTHVFGAEPISDETASSIKQMKDTMQSEKMTFFDGAELE